MTTIGQTFIRNNDLARFERSYERRADGCWIFTGRRSGGYGQFYANGKYRGAHRWSYEHFVGPIPPGHVIDHLCKVVSCVNPEHLEAVTPLENQRRRRQSTCLRGHNLNDPGNVWVDPKTDVRHCKACRRVNAAARRAAGHVSTPTERTECKRGHDLTDPENIYEYRGSRMCRPCRRSAGQRYDDAHPKRRR